MTIIGLFYLLLILGWIFLILVLKCKRARAKRLAEEAASAAIAAAAQPCHVIQIGSNYYDIIPVSSSNFGNYRSCGNTDCTLQHHRPSHDSNNNLTASTTSLATSTGRRASTNHHTNQAFIMDEGGIFPATSACPTDLPPSYDDVMRLPTSYPKVAPSPFTPSYDEIMQTEYERNARNNLSNNNNGGPAVIQVSSSTTENHESNQISGERNQSNATMTTVCNNNNNSNASNCNQNVV